MARKLSDAELGWVAGVLDLRGYLSERPSSQADRRLPTVAVTLADVEGKPHPAVAWLCQHTGVQPIPTGKGYNRTSCGEHCPEPHVHVSATYHRWIVGGAKARAVLASVLPLLVVRRAEARRLLAMDGRYKPAHVADMARRGWPGAQAVVTASRDQ
jgi:hypothetical protein